MRKFAYLLSVFLVLSTLLLTFSACGECEHTWDERGYVSKEPTDKEVGYRVYTCLLCGELNHVPIPMLTHMEHDYSKMQWDSDNTQHWLCCGFPDCDVITNKSPHIYSDSPSGGFVCNICQVKSSEHSFSDKLKYDDSLHWVLCDDEGCPAIAYRTPHTLPKEFEYDSNYHWGNCTFENCPAVAHKAAHTIENGKCTACDYTVQE